MSWRAPWGSATMVPDAVGPKERDAAVDEDRHRLDQVEVLDKGVGQQQERVGQQLRLRRRPDHP